MDSDLCISERKESSQALKSQFKFGFRFTRKMIGEGVLLGKTGFAENIAHQNVSIELRTILAQSKNWT